MPETDSDHPNRTGWAETAVERLSEDERLRGSLEDDGFSPLLNVAASLAIARSETATSVDDLYLALHQLVSEAVTSAEHGASTSLLNVARPLLSETDIQALKKALPVLGHDPNENAQRIARAIAAATGLNASGETGKT